MFEMLVPTSQKAEEMKARGFLPYRRVHRKDAGHQVRFMPEGYDFMVFWRQYKKAAFTATQRTVEKDDSRVLVDGALFCDSVPVRLTWEGPVVLASQADQEKQDAEAALASARELYPYAF